MSKKFSSVSGGLVGGCFVQGASPAWGVSQVCLSSLTRRDFAYASDYVEHGSSIGAAPLLVFSSTAKQHAHGKRILARLVLQDKVRSVFCALDSSGTPTFFVSDETDATSPHARPVWISAPFPGPREKATAKVKSPRADARARLLGADMANVSVHLRAALRSAAAGPVRALASVPTGGIAMRMHTRGMQPTVESRESRKTAAILWANENARDAWPVGGGGGGAASAGGCTVDDDDGDATSSSASGTALGQIIVPINSGGGGWDGAWVNKMHVDEVTTPCDGETPVATAGKMCGGGGGGGDDGGVNDNSWVDDAPTRSQCYIGNSTTASFVFPPASPGMLMMGGRGGSGGGGDSWPTELGLPPPSSMLVSSENNVARSLYIGLDCASQTSSQSCFSFPSDPLATFMGVVHQPYAVTVAAPSMLVITTPTMGSLMSDSLSALDSSPIEGV